MNSSVNTLSVRAVDNDANMQSSFRRLLAAIETEQEQIRSAWQTIEQEQEGTTAELERLRQDTEEWCRQQKGKIDAEWRRLDRLSERMGRLWDQEPEILEISCSGEIFTVLRSTMCSLEGSRLSRLFSKPPLVEIPVDEEGRYLLDWNPKCFRYIVEYLQNRRLRPNAPVPVIPAKYKTSMDQLAEAWELKPFLSLNKISPVHSTSLWVEPDTNAIQANHPGWQVISSMHPLPVAGASYFEVLIEHNPNSKGGMAIGVCGHIPQGNEVHQIRLSDSILYNSNNGIIGDCIEAEDVQKELPFEAGGVIGIKNDMSHHRLVWYYKTSPDAELQQIGSSILKQESLDRMRALYPVFALYVPGQRIKVNFTAPEPRAQQALTGP
jgi:hypothetical protein